MNDRVDSLRQRWQALAPREQWLCLLVSSWLALTVLEVVLVVVPPAPVPVLSLVVTWPELTRVSLMPWRCRFR
ncbi:hypothetical protein OMR07_04630 [Methylobacterium organophilum]|nr:hypothetical protein [Methylobacterium organophilum]